jgi:hypothetical protein
MTALFLGVRRAASWVGQYLLWLTVLGLILDHAFDTAGAAPVMFRYVGF